MKKTLSILLAAAMALGLATVGFAADIERSNHISGFSLIVSSRDDNAEYRSGAPYLVTYGPDNGAATDEENAASKVKIEIEPASGQRITKISTHANSKNVKVSSKIYDGMSPNPPVVTIKGNAGVRDLDWEDYEVEIDLEIGDYNVADGRTYNVEDVTITIYGDEAIAYSRICEVEDDTNYTISEKKGCVFKFIEDIDETVRIRCSDDVDVYFRGDYGDDELVNLGISTDAISRVDDFYFNTNVNYYKFLGSPRPGSKVQVAIEADPDTYLYEFKNNKVSEINAGYDNGQWYFSTRQLGTYFVADEEYKGPDDLNSDSSSSEEETEKIPPSGDADNANKIQNPSTGSNDYMGVASVLLVISVIVVAGLLFYHNYRKRRRS
ncbi:MULTISPECIES: hypothetical protein [Oscillospiraceae]|uniref:LPXTG cell wall anchor domain-containing protein n=1 Tax=Harryflintia acetispora TaxID=1849041 RepID=A0A9X8UL34_9FIRM|nr:MULTISPECIES: hypothetical protein [Oscillospiraceae]RGB65426.1 hypothetical protein DW086_10530 [Harryflintia acetispora]TCL45104.1 hypothetical protein EDD78_10182 [Harryflintia acetispora]